jgi:cardiolipin synthase
MFKRDPRSATIWVLSVLLVPVLGAAAYVLFGINRVNRKARHIRYTPDPGTSIPRDEVVLRPLPDDLSGLARLVKTVSAKDLTNGNSCRPLDGGSEAYPRMLEAISQAQHSIALASYIFQSKGIGEEFVNALVAAHERGVDVKILIDDVYVRMSFSDAYGPLRAAGMDVALFNSPIIPARLHSVNLRNHRKLLIVDGTLGFTGGMNIHAQYWRPEAPENALRDLHFELRGPVVEHLRQTFARDWLDSADMRLGHEFWRPDSRQDRPADEGVLARGVESGPDETLDRMRWVFMGAINAAKTRICVRTPYFLPDQPMIAAISAAALRGVEVDIVVPENSDHKVVKWASQAHYWQILEHGARIHERSGPFDHSKLMIVDGAWVCLGSANWDARSLRLNFEFNVELYDEFLAHKLEAGFDAILEESKQATVDGLLRLSVAVRLRNGIARLFAPIL